MGIRPSRAKPQERMLFGATEVPPTQATYVAIMIIQKLPNSCCTTGHRKPDGGEVDACEGLPEEVETLQPFEEFAADSLQIAAGVIFSSTHDCRRPWGRI
jgi:hypothetical protein